MSSTVLYHLLQNDQSKYEHYLLYFKLKIRRSRPKAFWLALFTTLLLFYIFGVFTHLLEQNYDTSFAYPLHVPNFRYLIESAKNGFPIQDLTPVNNISYTYKHNPRHKCSNDVNEHLHYPITLLIVVKSAVCNFVLRSTIRQTWGFENRFADVTIRTVFMLGQCASPNAVCSDSFSNYPDLTLSSMGKRFSSLLKEHYQELPTDRINCQTVIDTEQQLFNDIVQSDFIDSYYNNTLKTMSSLHWTAKHCSKVPFVLFVDDDYYVSVKNLLKFTRNYLQKINNELEEEDSYDEDLRVKESKKASSRQAPIQFDGRLYSGFVFPRSRPMRHLPSKWYISLDDYPYNRYPPYVTGGCYLANNVTVIDLHYASIYTKRFKYDDVYLGILAKKMDITLIENNKKMQFSKLAYDAGTYRTVISSHGYHNPVELNNVWTEQKSLGNA